MVVRLSSALFVVASLLLQYKFWFSDVGYFRARTLEAEVTKQRQLLGRLEERNRILAAEVMAQKHGLGAVEARARSDLGMIKDGETFYLVNARPADGP
jgi:cell division protein FtsB